MANTDNGQHVSEEQWKLEAEGVIAEIKDFVQNIVISNLRDCENCIFLNLTTYEGGSFCVKLSTSGYRVVGKNFDEKSEVGTQCFETPYALLEDISPNYKRLFSQALIKKLESLQSHDSE